MPHIVTALNLNKTPQTAKDYSMIFAKNVKVMKDGSLTRDDGINVKNGRGIHPDFDIVKIYGYIAYNTEFYLFTSIKYTNSPFAVSIDAIVKYDEKTKEFSHCETGWKYSGTTSHPSIITGEVVVSLKGDIILNIAEYNDAVNVPFKSINLSKATLDDDESIYTQAPKIPFINLKQTGYYSSPIPNGTYQFFVRYEIWEDYFTDWFPCSKTCYTGAIKVKDTFVGRLSYVDENADSGDSFIFEVQHNEKFNNYKSFQIGFILTHDNDTVARSWRKFEFGTEQIYFDYNQNFIRNEDIKDFLNPTYRIYNVKNVIGFKHKLYVSNYRETDFNPNLQSYANAISINIQDTVISNESIVNFGNHIITLDGPYLNTIKWNGTTEYVGVLDILRNFILEYLDDILSNNTRDTLRRKYNYPTYDPTFEFIETTGDQIPIQDPTNAISEGYIVTYNKHSSSTLSDLQALAGYIGTANIQINAYTGKVIGDVIKITHIFVDSGTKYKRVYEISLGLDASAIHTVTDNLNRQTLIPGQEYKFYVHWVKETGETTNGYQIGDSYICNNDFSDYDTMHCYYPQFTIPSFPQGYAACFFTIQHYKTKRYQIFAPSSNNVAYHNLELDLGLLSFEKTFDIITKDVTTEETKYVKGVYRPSNDSKDKAYYGAEGVVVGDQNNLALEYKSYIEATYTNDSKDIELVKCTPYILSGTNVVFGDLNDEELLGFICTVWKFKDCEDIFMSTDAVYNRGSENNDSSFRLEELSKNEYISKKVEPENVYKIYSNYNLNFMSLAFDVNETVRCLSKTTAKEGTTSPVKEYTVETDSFFITIIASVQLSYIYKLSGMYNNITRKTYIKYDNSSDKPVIDFENTIRASEMVGDENTICIFKFKPLDYYNIPRTKDIIVNLKTVGDQILVHTKDSLFAFDGSNRITSSGGSVQVIESDIFETGARELLTSERGYAGLQHKHQSVLTQYGYVFYDSDMNCIYHVSQEQGLPVLSESIDKLFKRKKITDVRFADDPYNDRILICVYFSDNKVATLSYNFKTKSFISLHDYKFTDSFTTKNYCYFIKEVYIGVLDDSKYADTVFTMTDTLYPSKTETNKCSIVDIVTNYGYEIVKTLNSIAWINSNIESFESTPVEGNVETLLVAEENIDKTYPGDYLRIYSDNCSTDLINILTRSNDYSLEKEQGGINPLEIARPVTRERGINPNSYKYPRYNAGYWSLNYFRNILNTRDITLSGDFGDNQSLIYGKYFVVRFVFKADKKFKLENVIFNYEQKQ